MNIETIQDGHRKAHALLEKISGAGAHDKGQVLAAMQVDALYMIAEQLALLNEEMKTLPIVQIRSQS